MTLNLVCDSRSGSWMIMGILQRYARNGKRHKAKACGGLRLRVWYVSRYLVALPSAEELRKFIENDREAIESSMREPGSAHETGPWLACRRLEEKFDAPNDLKFSMRTIAPYAQPADLGENSRKGNLRTLGTSSPSRKREEDFYRGAPIVA